MEQEELSIVAMFANTNHRALQELALYVKAPDGSSQKIYAWGGQTSVDMSQVPTFSLRHQLQVQCTYEGNKRTLMVSQQIKAPSKTTTTNEVFCL